MEDNKIDFNVLELFPTPVMAINLPNKFGHIAKWFTEQQMLTEIDEKRVDHTNYGDRSVNSYILDEPECSDLKSLILALVQEYGNMLGYDYEGYRFGQSWLSYKHPGQHHTQHTHPNSLISGVLYFGQSEQKTPAIRFHKTYGGHQVSYLMPKQVMNKKDLKYAWNHFDIDFSPGLLLLFPSYLSHSVPLNKTETVRCSLAFNSVPKVGFGDEGELTELKF